MILYGLFILGVNIKYMDLSILYRHINVPMVSFSFICPSFNFCMEEETGMRLHG